MRISWKYRSSNRLLTPKLGVTVHAPSGTSQPTTRFDTSYSSTRVVLRLSA